MIVVRIDDAAIARMFDWLRRPDRSRHVDHGCWTRDSADFRFSGAQLLRSADTLCSISTPQNDELAIFEVEGKTARGCWTRADAGLRTLAVAGIWGRKEGHDPRIRLGQHHRTPSQCRHRDHRKITIRVPYPRCNLTLFADVHVQYTPRTAAEVRVEKIYTYTTRKNRGVF